MTLQNPVRFVSTSGRRRCREIRNTNGIAKGQCICRQVVCRICPRTTWQSFAAFAELATANTLFVFSATTAQRHPTTRAAHRPGGLILLVRYQMRMITFPRRRLKTQRQAINNSREI